MKVLNLYSGLGGNRQKWSNVDVTAVELDPKIARVYAETFPADELVIGDAHEYLRLNHSKFDLIWSSPPCQSHSKMSKATRHKLDRYPDLKLYEEILFLQHFAKCDFVVENVIPYYNPLIEPSAKLGRHLFWSNFPIGIEDVPKFPNMINSCTVKGSEAMKEWLGIQYKGNIYYGDNHCPSQVLRNCVHPDLGLHVFNELLSFKNHK